MHFSFTEYFLNMASEVNLGSDLLEVTYFFELLFVELGELPTKIYYYLYFSSQTKCL